MKKYIKGWLIGPRMYDRYMKYKSIITNKLKYGSKVFKQNYELKDIHANERCFLIGTGSSIKEQNLDLLKNDIVIGVNGLYLHKDINKINPKYYVVSPIFESHSHIYDHDNFVNWMRDMDETLNDNTIMFFAISDKIYIDKYGLFQNKKIYWLQYIYSNNEVIKNIDLSRLQPISSVSEAVLSVAIYLGFKSIYMLGFDHDWFKGYQVYFDNERYTKHYTKDSETVVKEQGYDSEFNMAAHAKMFRKYKELYLLKKNIYNANANQNSYVDTFPKVPFESLFDKKE